MKWRAGKSKGETGEKVNNKSTAGTFSTTALGNPVADLRAGFPTRDIFKTIFSSICGPAGNKSGNVEPCAAKIKLFYSVYQTLMELVTNCSKRSGRCVVKDSAVDDGEAT